MCTQSHCNFQPTSVSIGYLHTMSSSSSSTVSSSTRITRAVAEKAIVRYFTNTILHHGRAIVDYSKQQQAQDTTTNDTSVSSRMVDLTDQERQVFRRHNYYGWSQGLAVGGITFALLLGVFRGGPRQVKRALQSSLMGSSSSSSKRTNHNQTPSSHRFQALDGRPLRSNNNHHHHHHSSSGVPPPPSTSSSFLDSETIFLVQFMTCGAIGCVMTTVLAGSIFYHTQQWYQDLSQLPMQQGTSYFCHTTCPQLQKDYQQLQDLDKQNQTDQSIKAWTIVLEGGSLSSSSSKHKTSASKPLQRSARQRLEQQHNDTETSFSSSSSSKSSSSSLRPNDFVQAGYHVMDLLQDPTTSELESIQQLLHNCQLRQRHIQSQLQQRNQQTASQTTKEDDPYATIVHLETPVPPDYLAVETPTD